MSMPGGYEAFESPEEQYYPTATLPIVYTQGYQIRQFGAGDCYTQGQYANITSALANPPAAMTAAVTQSITYAKNQPPYVVTKHDVDYFQAYTATGA